MGIERGMAMVITRALAIGVLTAAFAGSPARAAEAVPASVPEGAAKDALVAGFRDPPADARPGVYWYFMDGNLTREGMTADLESMREAGIGNLVFLEVNVGVPRGPVDFLSEEWQDLFRHAVREAERLGIEITLGSGPGWAGSGGPWVELPQSMQHLVASSVDVEGPARFDAPLARPEPRRPYFGVGPMSDAMRRAWESFYEDVALLAFPTPEGEARIEDVDEKALYYRAPFSSVPGVKCYLPAPGRFPEVPAEQRIPLEGVVDLTGRLSPEGRLVWDVPAGTWTLLRLGRTGNGATTRPAPRPGLGFECDKFDAAAFDAHFDSYVGKLLRKVGPRAKGRGWTMLHIDSWEMGAQNWTGRFREEFRSRRGYDPLPWLPTYTGRVVGSLEQSERFLWDVRITSQELIVENHAGRLKQLAHQNGFGLSIEPYDMNPAADLDLGAVADVPMCEFWSEGFGFDSSYSCIEAVSIAHTHGRPLVAAEAFTASGSEAWKLYPGALKNQGDWAFALGIHRFVYHTFAHKPQGRRPGMVMGPYGVHWDRGQTWWPMVGAYHRYVSRCQHLLRQGRAVADVCYLAPEGAPHVFRPPPSALEGKGSIRDRRGHGFDGCSPRTLIERARVRDGRIAFPGGSEYEILVLPAVETMTPALLGKITGLVEAGATVVGPPPRRAPGLEDYPRCDERVASMAVALWGERSQPPTERVTRHVGLGRVVRGGDLRVERADPADSHAIESARWIWTPEGNPAASAEVSTRHFRREVRLDADRPVRSARLEATADNSFEARIGGQVVLRGDNFHTVFSASVEESLGRGPCVLAIAATNGGDAPNPAGLIASLRIEYADGGSLLIVTDRQWEASRDGDSGWGAAKVLGPSDMSPWRLQPAPESCPELYPGYAATARLLAGMGILPDFESDGPIRFGHRRTDGADIYFVANRETRTVDARCTFRVTGRHPELFDPLDGSTRDLPELREERGRTLVPMRFEPHQSFFVVFRDPPAGNRRSGRGGSNFPPVEELSEVPGPWEVSFDPGAGGPPDSVRFATLQDWTSRSEESIRYYSGIATYRTTFDLPPGARRAGRRLLLDVGEVHALARVRLNGRDLGVLWCAPWRVDITRVAQERGNRLEIDVANLWPNRLIGDLRRKPAERVAWTTYNPYRADSPLLPSGLIGPVRLAATDPLER